MQTTSETSEILNILNHGDITIITLPSVWTNLAILVATTARKYGITPSQFLSRRRPTHLVDARTAFVREARELGYSDSELGKFLRVDRKTIINLRQRKSPRREPPSLPPSGGMSAGCV